MVCGSGVQTPRGTRRGGKLREAVGWLMTKTGLRRVSPIYSQRRHWIIFGKIIERRSCNSRQNDDTTLTRRVRHNTTQHRGQDNGNRRIQQNSNRHHLIWRCSPLRDSRQRKASSAAEWPEATFFEPSRCSGCCRRIERDSVIIHTQTPPDRLAGGFWTQ